MFPHAILFPAFPVNTKKNVVLLYHMQDMLLIPAKLLDVYKEIVKNTLQLVLIQN